MKDLPVFKIKEQYLNLDVVLQWNRKVVQTELNNEYEKLDYN